MTLRSGNFCSLQTLLWLAVGLLTGVGCVTHPSTARTPAAPPAVWPSGWTGGEVSPDLSQYALVNSRPGQSAGATVVVCISGGGMRAANFGAAVLRELEQVRIEGRPINLLKEVDYFSTVSGGGIAAGAYLAARQRDRELGHAPEEFRFAKALWRGWEGRGGGAGEATTDVAADAAADASPLKVALRHNFQAFIWGLLDPRNLGPQDRGDTLQSALDRRLLHGAGDRSLTMGDLFVPAGAAVPPQMPYWFPNATTVGNGAILPLAPDTLNALGVNGYSHRRHWHPLTNAYEFPLSVAVKASASFPGIIPATTLGLRAPSPTYLHLMDGGVGDNLGVLTALHLLTNSVHSRTRKLLIVIDAYQKEPVPFSARRQPPRLLNQVLNAANLPLESWHAGYENEIQWLEDENNRLTPEYPMRHVTIGFNDIENTNAHTRKLAEQTREVGTRLNLSPRTQTLLFGAARRAVRNKQPAIAAAVQVVLPDIGR